VSLLPIRTCGDPYGSMFIAVGPPEFVDLSHFRDGHYPPSYVGALTDNSLCEKFKISSKFPAKIHEGFENE